MDERTLQMKQEGLRQAEEEYLRINGWTPSDENHLVIILWENTIDGIHYHCSRETAMQIQRKRDYMEGK